MSAEGQQQQQTQELWNRAHAKQAENLEITQNIRGILVDTDETANRNLELLNEQGDQLQETERKLGQQNNALRNAEKEIYEMEKCCGCCVCPWNKAKSFERTAEHKKAYSASANRPIVVKKKQPKSTKKPGEIPPDPRSVPGSRAIDNEVADEIDDNLNDIGDYIRSLKAKAGEMGDEIDRQNVQLDRIHTKITANTARVEQGQARVNNILVNG